MIETMKRDLVDVISRYVEVDRETIDVTLRTARRTLAMLANIPILSVNRPNGTRRRANGNGHVEVRRRRAEPPVSAAPEPAAEAKPPTRKRRRRKKAARAATRRRRCGDLIGGPSIRCGAKRYLRDVQLAACDGRHSDRRDRHPLRSIRRPARAQRIGRVPKADSLSLPGHSA